MRERPILFSAPMVRAILEGRKTVTRRVAKGVHFVHAVTGGALKSADSAGARIPCPYGQPGDRLWLRETWMPGYFHEADHEEGPRISVIYRADNAEVTIAAPSYELAEQWENDFSDDGDEPPPWRPSIHMPRWASRITLEVTGVRVERLQDIDETDAIAEGVEPFRLPVHPANELIRHKLGFARLWDSLNGADSWKADPWVWVVGFKQVNP